jgi:hypothetical protein
MDEADAYTIPEFCVRNKICRAYYYKRGKADRGQYRQAAGTPQKAR